jgi:hypothetical protein
MAAFSVGASGTAPLSYQWYFNGTNLTDGPNISGSISNVLTLSNVQTTNGGSYLVAVTNIAGSVTSAVATLMVYVPPTISNQPSSQGVVQGQTALFSVAAAGTAPFSYQWYFNSTNAISGANNSTLNLTNVQRTTGGSYLVVVTNIAGSVTSAVATLTVYVPPIITTQPQSVGTVAGPGVATTFFVVASGTEPLTYQWYFNNARMGPGSTSSNLTVNVGGPPNAGNYTAVVKNNYGSVTSAVATLTVYVPPGIQTQPQNQTVLQGTNVSFSVVTNNSGTPPFGYQWSFNGTNVSNATNATLALPNVQTNNAGSYVVVVTNSWGSVTSAVAKLTVNVPPGIQTQPQSQGVAQGQNVSFSVVASGSAPLNYQWYFNGLAVGGPAGHGSTLLLNNVTTNNAGTYSVVVTSVAGSATSSNATLTVNVPAGIQTQPHNRKVTQGQTASFSVVASGTAPLSYQWSFNGTNVSNATNATLALPNIQTNNAGSYAVVVNNNWGSATSAVATLTVYVPPTITSQPQSQTVMAGQSASFSVVADGTGPLNYQWNFSGTPLGGATNAWLTLTNVHTNQAGNYTVVVTNSAGSIASGAALAVTNPVITLSATGGAGMGMTSSGFGFQLSVPLGCTYIIQASTDLQSWTPIATNLATSASMEITDSTATNLNERFYRAVVW